MPSRFESLAEWLGAESHRLRRATAPPWRPPADRPYAALSTVEDYRRCTLGASDAVRYVKVRARATDPRVKPGVVELRVRGRFRRRLSVEQVAVVRAVVAAHSPVGVSLRVKS